MAKKPKKPKKASNQRAAAAIIQKQLSSTEEEARRLVKKAKDAGCDAFDERGFIDMDALNKWIGENRESLLNSQGPLSLKDQKLNEEIRKLKLRNDREEKMVVSKSKIGSTLQKCTAAIDVLLEQKLENEYPTAVASLSVVQARVYGRRLGDLIRAEIHNLGKLWDEN